jgi:hypothetical protein
MDWMTRRSKFDPRRRQKDISFNLWVQTCSGAHPASYSMGTGGPFPEGKCAGAWRWPLTPIYCRGREWVGATPPLPPAPPYVCCGTALPLPFLNILLSQIVCCTQQVAEKGNAASVYVAYFWHGETNTLLILHGYRMWSFNSGKTHSNLRGHSHYPQGKVEVHKTFM